MPGGMPYQLEKGPYFSVTESMFDFAVYARGAMTLHQLRLAVGDADFFEILQTWTTANAVGVPKTGFPAETMARVAAQNIASQVHGEPPTKEENFRDIPAVCVLDAGNNGVAILADKMLPPRKHGVMIPGPQSHAAKIAFEKYFMWKSRHGYVRLP